MTYEDSSSKWLARNSWCGQRYHAGRYNTEKEAIAALQAAKERLRRADEEWAVVDRIDGICKRFPNDIAEAQRLQTKLSEHVRQLLQQKEAADAWREAACSGGLPPPPPPPLGWADFHRSRAFGGRFPEVEIQGALVTCTCTDAQAEGGGTAVFCGEVMRAEGDEYVEFTWVAGSGPSVGVADIPPEYGGYGRGLKGVDVTRRERPCRVEWEWMYDLQQGKACSGMLNGVLNGVRNVDRRPSDIHRRGDTVGLWLRRGRLSVWAAGGGMPGMGRLLCEGLEGELRWAARLVVGDSVRIVRKPAPRE